MLAAWLDHSLPEREALQKRTTETIPTGATRQDSSSRQSLRYRPFTSAGGLERKGDGKRRKKTWPRIEPTITPSDDGWPVLSVLTLVLGWQEPEA
ncbi:hypothetical protein FA13DRAFT_387258 [Coprinellus micaceus]|uniref:Uncharacterized protein n=1 Tax=Coprinellus micaceus TaxID=71717 RepID=A0A4Y7TYI1_COPMI|nr:hypothetical protein FA13DRAFT_387258 [Coprinellus micaceus]